MKAQAEVEDRVRALLVAELDRRVELAHQRLPVRCVHHRQQELDPRAKLEDEPNPGYNRVDRRHLPVVPTMGFCGIGIDDAETWEMNICEDPIDAQRCPDFTPNETREEILAHLKQDLDDFGWIQANMPELYGLLWVLDTGLLHEQLPWWKRLWFRFLRIRLEPVRSNHDVLRALPPAPPPEELREDDDGLSSS